jgi:hypothetical protein
MDIWPPKKPGETVAYPIDWREELDAPGPYCGDTIDTYTIVVQSGDAVLGVDQLDCNKIIVLVSGGTDGTRTTILNTITTVNGQILERTITLLVSDDAVPYAPSTSTKRLVVNMAYDEVRLSVPEFQVDPGELNTALTKLDILMAEWAVSGIYLGYNAPAIPGDGNLDDEIGIPNAALHATSLYLALRISPAFGKALSAESKIAMALALSNLRGMTLRIPNMRLPRNTPIGQGAQSNLGNFMNPFATGRGCC